MVGRLLMRPAENRRRLPRDLLLQRDTRRFARIRKAGTAQSIHLNVQLEHRIDRAWIIRRAGAEIRLESIMIRSSKPRSTSRLERLALIKTRNPHRASFVTSNLREVFGFLLLFIIIIIIIIFVFSIFFLVLICFCFIVANTERSLRAHATADAVRRFVQINVVNSCADEFTGNDRARETSADHCDATTRSVVIVVVGRRVSTSAAVAAVDRCANIRAVQIVVRVVIVRCVADIIIVFRHRRRKVMSSRE